MKRSEELSSMPNHIAYDNSTIGQANKQTWINNNFGNPSNFNHGYELKDLDIMNVSPFELSNEDLLVLIDKLKIEMDKQYHNGNNWDFSRAQDKYNMAKEEAKNRGILDNLSR